jgi:hypothetical protein
VIDVAQRRNTRSLGVAATQVERSQ